MNTIIQVFNRGSTLAQKRATIRLLEAEQIEMGKGMWEGKTANTKDSGKIEAAVPHSAGASG